VRVSALDEFCTIQSLASGSRIALFLFKIPVRGAPLRGVALLRYATLNVEGSYQPGSGRFCGGYPQERVIQQRRHTGNNRHIRKVKHVPIEGFSADLDVE